MIQKVSKYFDDYLVGELLIANHAINELSWRWNPLRSVENI